MGLPLEVEGIQLPEKRLSMRKIKEVLRLRHELGLHQQQIARSCSIGQSTVHRYLERAEAAQLVWPLAEDWDDAKIEQLLFPVKVGFKAAVSAPVDFAGIHQELVSGSKRRVRLWCQPPRRKDILGAERRLLF